MFCDPSSDGVRVVLSSLGGSVDGVKVEDVEQEVALAGAEVKLSSGKKKHALLVAK